MAVVGDLDKRFPPSGLSSLPVMRMAHPVEEERNDDDRTVESVLLCAVTQGQQVRGTPIRVSRSPQKPPGS